MAVNQTGTDHAQASMARVLSRDAVTKSKHPWLYRMASHAVIILQGACGLVTLAQFEQSLQLTFARCYALRCARRALQSQV